MAVKYKKKCILCKKNYVLVSKRSRSPPICYECEKVQMKGEIEDSKLKKLLGIPEEYYKKNSFLRRIKIYCHKYGSLSQKQVTAFKEVLKKIKDKEGKKK